MVDGGTCGHPRIWRFGILATTSTSQTSHALCQLFQELKVVLSAVSLVCGHSIVRGLPETVLPLCFQSLMLLFSLPPFLLVLLLFCANMQRNIAFRRVSSLRIPSSMQHYISPLLYDNSIRHSSAKSSPSSPKDQHKTNSIIDLTQPAENIKIPLLPVEENVFRSLQNFCDEKMVYVRIRVAGGWVRDKLLGLPSKYDIDFALENSTGAKFALALQDWLHEKGMNHMKLGVIQQNPEKSKHLETGTFE
ncbi:hypothetical protein EON65_30250 [archaeon]|nr:MAG: hypothetical protein EON65_30250 [archaeon]